MPIVLVVIGVVFDCPYRRSRSRRSRNAGSDGTCGCCCGTVPGLLTPSMDNLAERFLNQTVVWLPTFAWAAGAIFERCTATAAITPSPRVYSLRHVIRSFPASAVYQKLITAKWHATANAETGPACNYARKRALWTKIINYSIDIALWRTWGRRQRMCVN